MAETFRDEDLATLRSIARGAGIPDTDDMPHDELVDMLRRAGLAGVNAGDGDQPTRDPAGLAGLPRSSLTLGDESTGGWAAEESIGARPGESGTEIDDRTQT
ncbi:hypothetical protein [Micromonospora endophytica]|uniref:Uncharacterized protein n=1 Tax=Micromonospora endophytica TaxID=515350 RepID=A0A2W2C2Q6_9ACTN|nr:hypothetical protein [Micromonospora endophytica]PZF82479.1 hypothetical protein C1I93_30595 [Micromonospora endophytica]RIW43889.1 hypothetical protein D3H59_19215 [Micromonospora endophytica]BCJ56934.1 hypothetical protein Jiend_03560 [Micromonospora endophytica]